MLMAVDLPTPMPLATRRSSIGAPDPNTLLFAALPAPPADWLENRPRTPTSDSTRATT